MDIKRLALFALLLTCGGVAFAQTPPTAVVTYGAAGVSTSGPGSGTVTSISNADGTLTLAPNPIITTGTVSLNLAHSNTWTAMQAINLNTASLPTPIAGTPLQIAQADATANRIELDSWGALTGIAGRRANGTAASPSDTGAGLSLLVLSAYGRANGAYTTSSSGGVSLNTLNAWSVSDQSTQLVISLTPVGSTASATALTLTSSSLTLASGSAYNAVSLGSVTAVTYGFNSLKTGWYSGGQDASVGLSVNGSNVVDYAITKAGSFSAPNFNVTAATVPNNGIYLSSANTIGIATNSGNRWNISPGGNFSTVNANGLFFAAGAASATSPTFAPNQASATTGIGAQASGNMSFITAATEIMRITSTGPQIIVLPTDAATTDNSLCINTTTHIVSSGSGTLGICLGTSSVRYKRSIVNVADGLDTIMNLQPKNFRYLKGYGDNGAREQYGFIAEDVVKVLPKLVGLDAQKRPNTVDIVGMVPVIVKALQQMQGEINRLGIAALDKLREEVLALFGWNILLTLGLGYALVRKR